MTQTVTLIPGDGTGPEVTGSVQEVFEALGVDIEWEIVEAGESVMGKKGTPLPEDVLESIRFAAWLASDRYVSLEPAA